MASHEAPTRAREEGSTDERADRYFTLDELVGYSRLSLSTLRRFLHDARHPLPHHVLVPAGRTRGRILVGKRAFDHWVASFPGRSPGERGADDAAGEPADVSWVKRAFRK